jgi:hypothetical protein
LASTTVRKDKGCRASRPRPDVVGVNANGRDPHKSGGGSPPYKNQAKIFAIGFFCALLGLPALAQEAAWQRDLLAWREQHVSDLLRPYGWLSLAGLEWLQSAASPIEFESFHATFSRFPASFL